MDDAQDIKDQEDTQLMLRIREGDARAMEQLIRKHKDAVYATALNMLSHSPEAEDIAQQVFIRIWKSANTYEPKAKFTTWMYTILKNLVFNEMRRQKRKPTTSADALEEDFGYTSSVDSSMTPDDAMVQTELEQAVERAISELPEKSRQAIMLRRQENLSYEDMAAVMGVSVPAIKSILFRARTTLKDSLAKWL